MGFIIYGTFARLSTEGKSSAVAPTSQWGLIAGTSYNVVNKAGQGLDFIGTTALPDISQSISNLQFCEEHILIMEKSTHCWAYCDVGDLTDLSQLAFQWIGLTLPDGELHLATPVFQGRHISLMWPAPKLEFFKKARAIDAGKRVEYWPHKRDIDFLHGLACWQPRHLQQTLIGLTEICRLDEVVVESLVNRADPLRDKLAAMEHQLLGLSVVLGEVHPGVHSTCSTGYQLVDATPDWERYSFAWYSLSKSEEYDAEEYVRTNFDPEGICEELWERYEIQHYVKNSCTISETKVYFEARNGLDKQEMAYSIIKAANENGLKVNWSGDTSHAIQVLL